MSSFYRQKYCHTWVYTFFIKTIEISTQSQINYGKTFFWLSCKVGEMSLTPFWFSPLDICFMCTILLTLFFTNSTKIPATGKWQRSKYHPTLEFLWSDESFNLDTVSRWLQSLVILPECFNLSNGCAEVPCSKALDEWVDSCLCVWVVHFKLAHSLLSISYWLRLLQTAL